MAYCPKANTKKKRILRFEISRVVVDQYNNKKKISTHVKYYIDKRFINSISKLIDITVLPFYNIFYL